MKKAEVLNKANPYARFGATKFADLTAEEFKMYRGYKPNNAAKNLITLQDNAPLPTNFDWRDKKV